jgi:hypothetical protein
MFRMFGGTLGHSESHRQTADLHVHPSIHHPG